MSSARRSEELFHLAAELGAAERDELLSRECAGDEALRRDVESLLRQHDAADGFLETPLIASEETVATAAGPSDPERIGPYRILERIGEGGMGTVFLAEQEQPVRRRVALKIVKRGMDTEEVVARFEAERQALALMDHPGVARVFDGGATESGRPYFVMEHVQGVPITDYCDRNRLTLPQRLELFREVCEAVQHAHQKGIIHRDLKPSNVLVTELDGRPVPKVIDFGIARATGQRLTERTLHTRVGHVVGTLQYMSPEQADPTALGIDTRADVYSLGVLLHELLTGTLPYESSALKDLLELQRAMRDPVKPSTRVTRAGEALAEAARRRRTDARALARRLRGDLDWIALKALEPDRTRRYGSASELAADIGRHLAHEPVSAGPPSAGYRVRKFVRRNRTGVAAAAAVLLALVAGLAGTLSALSRTRAAERATAREAVKATEIKDYLVELLSAGNPDEQLFTAVAPSHLAREVRLAEILEATSRDFGDRFADDPEVEFELRLVLGQACFGLGLWDEAEPHLRRAVELGRDVLGIEDERTLNAMGSLTRVLSWTDRRRESVALAEEAAALARVHLGPEHRTTLRLTAFHAWYAQAAGQPTEPFVPVVRETYRTSERVLGPDHRETILIRVLSVRLLPGEEQEAFARETVARAERALPEGHFLTSVARFLHANALNVAGRRPEALALRYVAVEGYERHLGADHPLAVTMRGDIGADLVGVGRHEEAVEFYAAYLEGLVGAFPEDSLECARHFHAYAQALEGTGRTVEAAEHYGRALVGRRRHLGPDHARTRETYRGRLRAMGEAGAADLERDLRARLDGLRDELGDDDPSTLAEANELAWFLWTRGRAAEAEPIARAAVAGYRRLDERPIQAWIGVLDTWAVALRDTGQLSLALEVFEEIETLWPHAELDHEIRVRYGECLTRLGRHGEAEAVLLESEAGLREHPRGRRAALRALVELYTAWERPERAREYERLLAETP